MPTKLLCNCPKQRSRGYNLSKASAPLIVRSNNMNALLFEILKNIETLSNDDLDKIKIWIEYNMSKRNNPKQD